MTPLEALEKIKKGNCKGEYKKYLDFIEMALKEREDLQVSCVEQKVVLKILEDLLEPRIVAREGDLPVLQLKFGRMKANYEIENEYDYMFLKTAFGSKKDRKSKTLENK